MNMTQAQFDTPQSCRRISGGRKTGWNWRSFLPPSGASLSVAALLFPMRPPVASSIAQDVDNLYFFLTAVTVFFTVLIFVLIFYFMIKYRRKSEDEQPPYIGTNMALEVTWTLIPTGLCVIMFFWAGYLYVQNSRPPNSAIEMFVIGKQWMWHIQHPEGVREINEIHVPVGVPVKLTMTSQDVIHDFYIPAFRIKKDVLPGRYTSLWFEASEEGTYHVFCGQYCGAEHSAMIGWVYVMKPADYARWLASSGNPSGLSMAQMGEKLFSQYGCISCHFPAGGGVGPSLLGVYGHPQKLQDGRTLVVDETFLRNAITNPNSMPVPGFTPAMPSFQGQMDEEQLLQLIAYIKTLGSQERTSETP
jgi:cytochrome c oxidase subunit II